jgi:hypothetical protein
MWVLVVADGLRRRTRRRLPVRLDAGRRARRARRPLHSSRIPGASPDQQVVRAQLRPEPGPSAPISIARAEFDAAYQELRTAGLPVREDADAAWRDFAGWRVNYDEVLVGLAAVVSAPYAPWSSDRGAVRRRPSPIRAMLGL